MEALGLKEVAKPETAETGVSLGSLSELTGFPIEYIKRELLLDDSSDISMEELRAKVLAYLSSEF
jgi:hypothetical protein